MLRATTRGFVPGTETNVNPNGSPEGGPPTHHDAMFLSHVSIILYVSVVSDRCKNNRMC